MSREIDFLDNKCKLYMVQFYSNIKRENLTKVLNFVRNYTETENKDIKLIEHT